MCDRHANSQVPVVTALMARAGVTAPATSQLPDTSTAEIEPARSKRPARRLKLWELAEKLHCPVIGTCLDLSDLQRIARKSGYEGRVDDAYQLHVEAVSLSCTRNVASEAMQHQLERRHALAVRQFQACKDDASVHALWKAQRDNGVIAGAVWAALTHRHASEATQQAVYADLHMLSHQVGAGQIADVRALHQLREENRVLQAVNATLKAADTRAQTEQAAMVRDIQTLSARLRTQANVLTDVQARLQGFETGQAFIALGRRLLMAEAQAARTTEVEMRLNALTQRLGPMRAEKVRLTRELQEVRAERDAMEQLWAEERVSETGAEVLEASCSGACDSCSNRLQGRCVLCVGGRTPLLPQYRQLAQRLGVRLIHHDGGREEHLSRLPELLKASDAVICPTDCVGHLAYYQLKKHCKQNGKPCVLAKSSGVAGFAAALTRLAEGRADIHSQI